MMSGDQTKFFVETLDVTDVARVTGRELALPMRVLLRAGGIKALGTQPDEQMRAAIEERFWRAFTGSQARGTCVLLRFWSLVDVFGARRLKNLVEKFGPGLVAPAIQAAATMRLNVAWGFNPQKLINLLAPTIRRGDDAMLVVLHERGIAQAVRKAAWRNAA